jgi:hypothetical protein
MTHQVAAVYVPHAHEIAAAAAAAAAEAAVQCTQMESEDIM